MIHKIKKGIAYILILTSLPLALCCCSGNDVASSSPTDNILLTPSPTLSASNSIVQNTPSPFNPLFAFYSDYNAYSKKQLSEYVIALEGANDETLLKLFNHLFYSTLPMNTVGLLISSTSEDYYGSLFDGFEGSGSMLTYDDRYEFSYDFANGERLWGTFNKDGLSFYKSFSGTEDYYKMTLLKTEEGYTSTCRTQNETTTLHVTAQEITFN